MISISITPGHSIYDPTNPMGKMFFNVLVTFVGMMVNYADDIEEACLITSRFAALMDIDFLPEPDKSDIAIIPVIDNLLFQLMLKKTD
ncbi:hypothetical protein [Photorhabdus australis]|uniref:hypothetical protein n=1 Tax=Photorhabdus australis TaxID=286156 RepID=UPI00056B0A73|nr:hypothetical protein [Photorhabdus australis]